MHILLIKLKKKISWTQVTGNCFIQKIYAPSSSLLQGKHLPFSPSPLPHFASIFFAYLWFFRWPNYIVTLPRYFSFRLPHLNINTGPPSDELGRSGEGVKGRCLPWTKEEAGAYIFWMKQVHVDIWLNKTSNLRNHRRSMGSNITEADFKIGICCFSAKHAALRRNSKNWLARNQNNVPEWSDMFTRELNSELAL